MTRIERLTDEALTALLNDTESDRVERKETFRGEVPEGPDRQSVRLQMICRATMCPVCCL